MQERVRKQVGQENRKEALKRLYDLSRFLKPFQTKVPREQNIKPVRRVVGRSR